jgi:unsaturated rhamnogalacturonyl hydrolase
MKRIWILLVGFLIVFQTSFAQNHQNPIKGLEMASRMADSEIKHFPEPWSVDFNPKPVWNYTQGLIADAMIQVWKVTGNLSYYNYAKAYADKMIDSTGIILGYKSEEYNIDCVNSGKFLFDLYEKTRDQRYLKAINHMRDQLRTQPRTSEGGFWHKQRYPNQMWLDGLYMGAPFLAKYALETDDALLFDDVINQFVTIHKHTYNAKTGLNYHGWDESKQQKWADPVNGCSPNFWGRAIGWYAMALVDVLDYMPIDHPGRIKILQILNQVASGIKNCQDKKTGLWFQVLDQGVRKGNYLEATASSMFTYTLLKATRKDYISKDYHSVAVRAYNGLLNNFIQNNSDGTISLTKCCAVAGLGGTPYRDGSFEYYIKELVRADDPKGVGPFVMASLEYSKQE